MSDDASKGFFGGTIFEGGLSGAHKKHGGHESLPVGSFDYFKHNTKFGHFIFESVAEWGISRALSLSVVFIGLLMILALEIPNLPLFITEWAIGTAPVWAPIVLIIASWNVWVWYIQGLFISSRDPVVLDIKIPREITKSPRAMELAMTSLYNTSGEGSFLDRIWHGQVRVWYSFEYASFGGEVHMFVWCWKGYRHVVETALYAQYPEIEIYQVPDYASQFKFDPAKHKAFVTEHRFAENSAYPLKTYIEYELDKDPKEEFKVDPMAQAFEYMSSLKKGEQMWVQVIFRASAKQDSLFNPKKGAGIWKALVKSEVEKIRKKASLNPGKTEDTPDSDERKYGFPRPTWSQTEQMRIMERQLGKIPFDIAVRGLYIAEKNVYNGATGNGMRWFWKPLNSGYLNSLEPDLGSNSFDYPWQDFLGFRDALMIRRYIDGYRRRCAFHAPWYMDTWVMTNEVIATMFHPPSSSIVAPGLLRISSVKAEPPSNLPK